MADRIKESDWKLLRSKLPTWQETHMEKLMRDYSAIANSDSAASERFWELEKRIKKDKKSSGVVVYGLSRSKAESIITNLLLEGVISFDDLEEFSDELKERAAFAVEVLSKL